MENEHEMKLYIEDLVYNNNDDNLDIKSIQKLVRIKYGMSKLEFKKYLNENNIVRSIEITNQIKSIKLRESIHNNPDIIERRKQTNFERHGYYNYNNKEKAIQTNLRKYRVENVFQAEEIKEKIRATKQEKYDDPTYTNVEKQVQTNLGRYSVRFPLESEEIRNKAKQTNIEKHNVENVFQAEEVKEKIKNVKQEKYNNPYYNNPDKVKQTNLERYNVEYPLQSEQIRDKLFDTNMKKFGSISPFGNKDVQIKSQQTMEERYGTKYIMQNQEVKERAKNTSISKYGVPYNCMTPQCIDANGYRISKANKLFKEKLEEVGINSELEFNIEKYSYDLHIKNSNILIELNPTVTHNTEIAIFKSEPKAINYHKIKSDIATENKYRCIHVFDWDNTGKILEMLKLKQNIYARNLKINKLTEKDTNIFLNEYHLQNTCKGQIIRLGLYYKDELIQVMTFGKPRYNKNYEWELLRLCTKFEYKVIGGAEKLFKYFIKNYNPKSIISYCDLAKFTGEVYERLGFILNNITKPAKHWSKGKQQITDNLLRQRGYDQLFGTNYGKGTSNEQLILENGWLPVYDCGQAVYLWKDNIK